MKNNALDKKLSNQLVQITPVIRGLLAEETGNEDIPYKPVILKSLTSKEALDFAAAKNPEAGKYPAPLAKTEKPPLFLDAPDINGSPENIRKKISDAVSDYSAKHKSKPPIVCIQNLGVLYIEQNENDSKLPLHNKVALVTGAAGAIGFGVCRGLLEAGCRLAATDLPGKKLDELADDLSKIAPNRVIGPAIDVTDKDSVSKGFEDIIQTWGGTDIVVVNAGIPLVASLKDIDLDEFRKLEKVNVEGALLTLAEASKLFIAQGTGGDIIVISTKNVPAPGAGFGAYSATKAACHQLGRIASIEMAQYGVRVNMVAPDGVFAEGKYKSGLWESVGPDRMRARGLDEKGLQEYYRNRNLLKAKITGRHVSNAVLFFATRQTPTTGATIPVDGGLPDATPR
jgi:NAD(P)-dependent dehydrogenase (short-subunit alcohol dehydrogenase family)